MNVVYSVTSQFIINCQVVLSMGKDQNVTDEIG